MPETATAVAAYFGTAAAGTAELGVAGGASIAGGASFEAGAAAVAAAEAGSGAAAAGGFGAAAGVAAGTGGASGGYLGAAGKAATGAAASAAATALLSPKPPKVPGALPMPDPASQDEARKRSIAEQMARRGRASTVLTNAPSGGTLGG